MGHLSGVSQEARSRQINLNFGPEERCGCRIKGDSRNDCFMEYVLDYQEERNLSDKVGERPSYTQNNALLGMESWLLGMLAEFLWRLARISRPCSFCLMIFVWPPLRRSNPVHAKKT